MFTYTLSMKDVFEEAAQWLLRQKTSLLADEILSFWRAYEPKRIETLFLQGALRKTIKIYERSLLDMQKSLEEREQLPPCLAKSEAWRNLMRIEEDEEEDPADREADWGPWREEYRNLMDKMSEAS